MNPNTLKMTKIVACDNLFSSHYQWLMSANLHFLTGRYGTISAGLVVLKLERREN